MKERLEESPSLGGVKIGELHILHKVLDKSSLSYPLPVPEADDIVLSFPGGGLNDIESMKRSRTEKDQK